MNTISIVVLCVACAVLILSGFVCKYNPDEWDE